MVKKGVATNIIFSVLLAITFATTLVSLIECYNIRKYISQEKTLIEKVICSDINTETQKETQLNDIYESYYANLQDKADSTIDKIVAFVGCIFSITTIPTLPTAYRVEPLENDTYKIYINCPYCGYDNRFDYKK